jgi:pilus assembly protein Flp/PilA
MRLIVRFLADERGASAVEYCIVASLIALYVIGGLGAVGVNLRAKALEIAELLLGSCKTRGLAAGLAPRVVAMMPVRFAAAAGHA